MKQYVPVVLAAAVLFSAAGSHADDVDDLINTLKPTPLNHAVWTEALLTADVSETPRPYAFTDWRRLQRGVLRPPPAGQRDLPAAWHDRRHLPRTRARLYAMCRFHERTEHQD